MKPGDGDRQRRQRTHQTTRAGCGDSPARRPQTGTTLTTTAGTRSLKTATVRIASNDGDENPLDIPLRLLSLNPAADTDGDSIATLTPPHIIRIVAR